MTLEQIARAHADRRARAISAVRAAAARAWARVDPSRITGSWTAQLDDLLLIVAAAQTTEAAAADRYLQATAPAAFAAGTVAPATFGGIASDGRPLRSLLAQPAVASLVAIRDGAAPARALAGGAATLDMIVSTQVADAGRTADQVALTARPRVSGWVRMLRPPSCSRCVVLAGRRYRWNDGFRRHPRCDCVHIPAADDAAGDLRTNPRAYFDGLSPAEQDRVFTGAGAQAIRDGADLAQVVNARRGAAGLTPAGARLTADELRELRGGRDVGRLQTQKIFGRQLHTTTEGTTVRGRAGVRRGALETGERQAGSRYRAAQAPRLMPESIYQIAAGDRVEAIRLLRVHGYLT